MDAEQAASRRMGLLLVGGGLLAGLAAGLIVFFGLPALGLGGARAPLSGTPSSLATPAPAPVVGAPAPDFSLASLAGQPQRLAGLKGQVVLLNFWATWCGPCEAEMPAIQQRYQKFAGRGLVVWGVNLAEAEADVRAFVQRLNISFTILMDPQESVFDLYRVRGYPTTFIIGRDGRVAVQHVGFMSETQIDQYLSQVGFSQ